MISKLPCIGLAWDDNYEYAMPVILIGLSQDADTIENYGAYLCIYNGSSSKSCLNTCRFKHFEQTDLTHDKVKSFIELIGRLHAITVA